MLVQVKFFITINVIDMLFGNQKKMDLNKNGKIDAEDLKLLRQMKNKNPKKMNISYKKKKY